MPYQIFLQLFSLHFWTQPSSEICLVNALWKTFYYCFQCSSIAISITNYKRLNIVSKKIFNVLNHCSVQFLIRFFVPNGHESWLMTENKMLWINSWYEIQEGRINNFRRGELLYQNVNYSKDGWSHSWHIFFELFTFLAFRIIFKNLKGL